MQNKSIVAAALALLVVATLGLGQSPHPAFRVGTYDSRAIAIAYAHSSLLQERHRGLMTELEQAKAAKNEKRVAELQGTGKALQHLLHQQGFSTGSVVNIMDRIKDAIPGVAKDAGVLMVVSKWEVLYRDPSIEYVDLTMPLVKKLNPSERALQLIADLPKHEPVPIEKILLDEH